MAYVAFNNELNGIEISFGKKPDVAILETLKSAGYKWHNKKKLWYAKRSDRTLDVLKIFDDDAEAKPEKDLKSIYMEMIEKEVYGGRPDMLDYIRKQCTDEIVELNNGDLYAIEKPRIETRFCFGYGYCGVSTQEDYNDAEAMRSHAATSEEYFFKENIKGLEEMINDLNNDEYYFYKFVHYNGCSSDSKIKDIRHCRFGYTPEYAPHMWSNLQSVEQLTDSERKALIKGYENVKTRFEKRLRTYLKKYGTSKLHTWTYLSD